MQEVPGEDGEEGGNEKPTASHKVRRGREEGEGGERK